MFQKVFLFNGIGSSYEKLLAKLPPELNDKYSYYYEIACARLGLNKDIEKMVLYIVLPEVPIKVVKKEKIEYSRGDGWAFVSEKDYESSKKDEIDPRLQKLKEYRFEEDD